MAVLNGPSSRRTFLRSKGKARTGTAGLTVAAANVVSASPALSGGAAALSWAPAAGAPTRATHTARATKADVRQ